MLTELHARLAIEPHCLSNTADRTLPDISGHPTAPGDLHGSGQRDRGGLLRFHRLVEARAADPPCLLLVLWPSPALLQSAGLDYLLCYQGERNLKRALKKTTNCPRTQEELINSHLKQNARQTEGI